MSAEELIALLNKHSLDGLLIASDEGGTSFSALIDVSVAFVDKGYRDGPTDEVWSAEEFEEDGEEPDLRKLRKVLVLWPST